jgi:hypothetical protein
MRNILTPRNVCFLAGFPVILIAMAAVQPIAFKSGTSGQPTAMHEEHAQSASAFLNSIGVNAHLNYFDRTYGNFNLVKRELQSLGILHVRDGAHLISPEYNQAVYSRWVQLGALGIRFNAVVDPRSKLSPITADKLIQIENLSGHTIESFEGPNELDISGMKDWTSVLRNFQADLYKAVKVMPDQPSIAVIGPSLAAASNGSKVGDISQYLDYGNLHPYPAGKKPSDIFPSQLQLARELSGNKPVIVTETGYHNAMNDHHDQPSVSEEAAASYITRLYLENFSHGIVRTYWYELLDEAAEPSAKDNQMHWGLIRSDGTEKPAFQALKNLVALVRDSSAAPAGASLGYSLNVSGGSVSHLLLQKSNGAFLLILWQPISSYDRDAQADINNAPVSATLTMEKPAKRLQIFDTAPQPLAAKSYTNVQQQQLSIPDHAIAVEIQ